MVKTNFFITGKKGSGKSFILEKIIREMGIDVCGYRTRPYYIEGERKGFYFEGLVDLKEYENNRPISVQISENSCIPILHTFDDLGVKAINKSLMDYEKVILMDELGILESKSEGFVKAVIKSLESEKIVIGALKKADNEFLNNIRARKDTLIFDLDIESQSSIYTKIVNDIKEKI